MNTCVYKISIELTGTTSNVDKKLHRYSCRTGSDDLFFPSWSSILGRSGINEIAALKNASAVKKL